jgi:hypothetical protein
MHTRIPLALAVVAFSSAALPTLQPPGALVVTAMSPPPRVCLGESTPIQIFVSDAVTGLPLGGAVVTMTSSLGAAATAWTPGGPVTLTYQPRSEGSDSLQIQAVAPNSAAGAFSLPAQVERCSWTWELSYAGTYPGPQGFWTFYEQASGSGSLQVEGNGSALSGEGTVEVSADMSGADPHTTCSLNQTPQGVAGVTVTGTLGVPSSGSMMVNFSFDQASLPGGGTIQCDMFGEQVSVPMPMPSASADLNAFGLASVVVPTDSGSVSRSISTAVVWQVAGNGSLDLVLTRSSP